MAKLNKDTIKIDPKNIQGLMNWVVRNSILYGDCIEHWWTEEGIESFMQWAEKKGIEIIDYKEKHG